MPGARYRCGHRPVSPGELSPPSAKIPVPDPATPLLIARGRPRRDRHRKVQAEGAVRGPRQLSAPDRHKAALPPTCRPSRGSGPDAPVRAPASILLFGIASSAASAFGRSFASAAAHACTNGARKLMSPASDPPCRTEIARLASFDRSASATSSIRPSIGVFAAGRPTRQPQRQLHIARADRLRKRFLRDRLVGRSCSRKLREQFRRTQVIALDRGGAGFDVGSRGTGQRKGRRRRKQSTERDGQQQALTCSDNLALHRLRE